MSSLTPELHARIIANSLKDETISKYLKGAAEHGGNLWEVPLPVMSQFAVEEAIDQGVYLKTIQQQHKWLIEWLTELFHILEALEEAPGDDSKALIAQIKELMGM